MWHSARHANAFGRYEDLLHSVEHMNIGRLFYNGFHGGTGVLNSFVVSNSPVTWLASLKSATTVDQLIGNVIVRPNLSEFYSISILLFQVTIKNYHFALSYF